MYYINIIRDRHFLLLNLIHVIYLGAQYSDTLDDVYYYIHTCFATANINDIAVSAIV